MADSIVEILNTSITSTELPTSSSSHTIITTDANTSYVIKDVQANGYVDGLLAKVNNFTVGDWSQTRTGSEVIGVSSTVSVSCANFPINVKQLRASTYNGSAALGTDELFGIVNGLEGANTVKQLTPKNPSTNTGTTYLNTVFTVNEITYQIFAQNNNIRGLYKWDPATAASPLGLTSSVYALLCMAEDQDAVFYRNGTSLRKVTLSTGVVTTIMGSRYNLPDASSTYERSAYCNGWLFEWPNNNATNYVYALNSSTGIYIKFTNLQTMSDYSAGSVMGVSYDEATDKFYIYRFDSNSSPTGGLYKDVLPLTKTQMDANVSDTTNSTTTTRASILNYTLYFTRSANNFADNIVGNPTDGNLFYMQTVSSNYNVFEVNFSLKSQTLYAKRATQGTIVTGAFLSFITPNATQINTLGFASDPSEIQLRITGVKTTA